MIKTLEYAGYKAVVNLNWLQKQVVKMAVKASASWRSIVYYQGLAPHFMGNDYQAIADEGYRTNPYVFRSIDIIAKNISRIPWVVYDTKGKEKTEIPNHPFTKLINKPNPLQSKAAFFNSLIGYWYIGGEVFIEAVGPQKPLLSKPPTELYALRPDRIDIQLGDSMNPIAKYEYRANGPMVEYEPQELRHFKFFNPLDDWRGMSPFRPGALSIDQNNESKKWNMSLLQNGGKLSGALVTEQQLTDSSYERAKEQLKVEHAGSSNAGKIGVFEGGLKWVQMGADPTDMDWLAGQKLSAREVAIVTGVPPELLGDSENKTYSNQKEARKALYQETILPLMDYIKDELNNWIAPLYGDNIEFDYDKDSIDALSEDRNTVWERVKGATFLTENEKRESLGYGRVDGLDVFRIPMSYVDIAQGEQAGSEGDINFKSLSGGSDAKSIKRSRVFKRIHTTLDRYTDAFRKELTKYFTAQEKRLLKNISESKSMEYKADDPMDEAAAIAKAKKAVDDMTDWTSEVAVMTNLFNRFYDSGLTEGYSIAKDIFGITMDFGIVKPSLNEWIKDHGAQQVTYVTETTKDRLRKQISKGLVAGESNKELAVRIQSVMTEAKTSRALTIAKTETHNSIMKGNYDTQKKSGIKKKKWVSARDEAVRGGNPKDDANHIRLDGEIQNIDEPFSNGLMFPGDPSGEASEIINCRCIQVPADFDL